MTEVILLGTSAALGDGSREPTSLALRGRETTIVVDCGANPLRQLQRLGIPLASLERVILTHSHPDHTSGFPLLVEMLWLAGRRHPLPVHGPADALDVARRAFAQWDTSLWQGLFELDWRPVALDQGAPVVRTAEFDITAAPGVHSVPVIGLRVLAVPDGGTLAYSADGEPSDGVRYVAQGVDLLVHEATGDFPSHSSAQAAAQLAREAGARRLVLVHLAPQIGDLAAHLTAARAIFGRDVRLGEDLARYTF